MLFISFFTKFVSIENKPMPKELKFNKQGLLVPADIIEVELSTFKAYFVDAFPNSKTRKSLFENYLRYIYRFQDDVFPIFEQWINGSFVTKKENPNDIDLVTFLNFRAYEARGDKILDKFWTFSLEEQGIDSYIVKEFPEHHTFRKEYLDFQKIWYERYIFGKHDIPKGFIKIKFEK